MSFVHDEINRMLTGYIVSCACWNSLLFVLSSALALPTSHERGKVDAAERNDVLPVPVFLLKHDLNIWDRYFIDDLFPKPNTFSPKKTQNWCAFNHCHIYGRGVQMKKKNKEKPGPETSAPLYRVQGLRRVHERVWRDWGSGRESSVTSWTNGSFLKLGVLPQNDNMCMFRFHVPERYMVPMDDSCYKSSQRKSNLSGEADLKGVSLNLAMLLETSKTLMKLRSFSLPIF